MNKRQKILFISHDSELTGAPKELLLIIKHLDKSKFEPIVLLGKVGPLQKQFEQHAAVMVHELFGNGPKYIRELMFAPKRLRILRQLKPGLVYCNTIMNSKWLLYAKLLKLPTIVHVHELQYVFRQLSALDRYLLFHFTDKFIAASSAVQKNLLTNYNIDQTRVVLFNESIEIGDHTKEKNLFFLKQLFPSGCDLVVGTIGRVAQMKGTDLFITVARNIKESLSGKMKIKFLIVGGIPAVEKSFFENVNKEIEINGLKNDVVITGFIENVPEYLSLIDIFILPSREDPFPLVILEAMASAKPIVAFDVGGIPEAITPDCGILIQALDTDAMKDAILRLVMNPQLRKRIGDTARIRVEHRFNIERNITKIEEIIASTIEPPHSK